MGIYDDRRLDRFSGISTMRGGGYRVRACLHIGSTAGAPWWDMWDQKIIDRMDQVARDQILPLRDDPRVLGYYLQTLRALTGKPIMIGSFTSLGNRTAAATGIGKGFTR